MNKNTLFSGFVVIVLTNILSKVISLMITWKIVQLLVSDTITDQYFLFANTIMLVAGLINSLDVVYVLPNAAILIKEENGIQKELKLLDSFFRGYLFTCFILIGLFLLFHLLKFPTFNFSIGINEILSAGALLTTMTLYNFLTNICYYKRVFNSSAVFSILVQAISLLFLYLFHKNIAVYKILVYQSFAYLLASLFLFLTNKSQLLFIRQFFTRWIFPKHHLLNIVKLQSGMIFNFLQSYSVLILLSGLGVGYVSSYNYAYQIVSIPGQFFLTYFSVIVGVKFTEISFKNTQFDSASITDINSLFKNLLLISSIVTVNATIFLFLNSFEILSFIFNSSGLNESSLNTSAVILQLAILYLPAAVINVVYSKIFHVLNEVNYSSLIQIGFNVLIIILSYVLSLFFDYKGVFLGISIGYTINSFFVLPFLVKQKLNYLRVFKVGVFALMYFIFSILIHNLIFSIIAIENGLVSFTISGLIIILYMLASIVVAQKAKWIDLTILFGFLKNSTLYQRVFR